MEEVVDSHNETYEIEEDRQSSNIKINGHSNKLVCTCNYIHQMVVHGHNNYIHGENQSCVIGTLLVSGHNNTIWNLKVKKFKVTGHNNNFKNLHIKDGINN